MSVYFLVITLLSFAASATTFCSSLLQEETLRSPERNGLHLKVPTRTLYEASEWQPSSPIRPLRKGQGFLKSFADPTEVFSLAGKKAIQVETSLLESEVWIDGKELALPGSRHRVLVKARFESEHVFVDVIDSEIRTGLPRQIFEHARSLNLDVEALLAKKTADLINYKDAKTESLLKAAQTNALREGRDHHLKALREILDFIFPLYRDRRGWNENFIGDLEDKAAETLNSTRYIVVRKKLEGNVVGPIIATMGLTKAPYGAVEFFNKATGNWERHFGPFGSAHQLTFIPDGHTDYKGFAPLALWDAPVPIVPTEVIFGTHTLPRPLVGDWPYLVDSQMALRIKADFERQRQAFRNEAIDPDFTQPIRFLTGQIIEPVKFGVAKESDLRGIAYVEILKEMFAAIFPSDLSQELTRQGQILETYNDRDGVIMYRRMGFTVPNEVAKRNVDGIEWTPLVMTPDKLVSEIIQKQGLTEAEAKSFFDSLSWSFSHQKGFFKTK